MRKQRISLVVPNNDHSDLDWSFLTLGVETLVLRTVKLLDGVMDSALATLNLEIVRVIFDRSIARQDFLEWLHRLPKYFTGEVLWIDQNGAGLQVLSTYSGRTIHRLTSSEVGFYLRDFDYPRGGRPVTLPLSDEMLCATAH